MSGRVPWAPRGAQPPAQRPPVISVAAAMTASPWMAKAGAYQRGSYIYIYFFYGSFPSRAPSLCLLRWGSPYPSLAQQQCGVPSPPPPAPGPHAPGMDWTSTPCLPPFGGFDEKSSLRPWRLSRSGLLCIGPAFQIWGGGIWSSVSVMSPSTLLQFGGERN